jgi:hypothetical protein
MKTRTVAAVAATLAVLPTVAAPAAAMTNGIPIPDPAAAPWVAVLTSQGTGPLMDTAGCDGALIGPDRVLTTARCVAGIDPSREQVRLAANTLSAGAGEVRGVSGIAVMPGYQLLPSPVAPDDKDLDSTDYDLAVVLLDQPVTDIQPLLVAWHSATPGLRIGMYSHGLTGRTDAGGPGPAAGAGTATQVSDSADPQAQPSHTSAAQRDDVLHRGDMTVVPTAACANATPATVDPAANVCAQDPAGAVTGCWLDGGSPAVSYAQGIPELVGTYAFGGETAGKDCAPPAPAVFVDAPRFRNWILGPLPERAPFPAGQPQLVRTGDTLSCAVPGWDENRGQDPSTVTVGWVALVPDGDTTRQLPIDGDDSPRLRLTDDLNLRGNQVACVVRAAGSGGSVAVLSPALTV